MISISALVYERCRRRAKIVFVYMSQVPPSHCIRLIVKTKKTRPYPLDVATAPPLSFQKKRIYSSRTWSDGFFYIPRVCTSTNIFKFVFGLLNQTRIRLWSSQNQNRIPFRSSQPNPPKEAPSFILSSCTHTPAPFYTHLCGFTFPPLVPPPPPPHAGFFAVAFPPLLVPAPPPPASLPSLRPMRFACLART